MPWNQPGGSDGKDPWGNRNNPEGPPDLDEVVKNLQKRFTGLFGGRGGRGGDGEDRNSGGGGGSVGVLGIFAVLILLLGAWLATGIYIVEEGEAAVIQRFGKYVDTTRAGLHWHMPMPIESRTVVNTDKVNTVEVGYRTANNDVIQTFQRESLMLTEDENIIDIAFAVQYRIKSPTDFLFNVSDNKDIVVRSATEAAIRETVGKTSMDDAMTSGRSLVVSKTREIVQRILDVYESGIEIVTVEMQHALPPAEVKAAFDDAVKAREDEVRFKNEAEAYANDIIPRARGQAARITQQAEAYKATVIANATGEADRFSSILAEYRQAPAVTRERMYIETMQNVLSDSNLVLLDQQKGNNIMYLPLDRLLNRGDIVEKVKDFRMPSENSNAAESARQLEEYRQRGGRSDRDRR